MSKYYKDKIAELEAANAKLRERNDRLENRHEQIANPQERELKQQSVIRMLTKNGEAFPPEALFIALGKCITQKTRGFGIDCQDQIIDGDGRAWIASIDRHKRGVKLQVKERWADGGQGSRHWHITLDAFDNILVDAQPLEVGHPTSDMETVYKYATGAGKTYEMPLRKGLEPPPTVSFKEETYALVSA